MISRSIIAREYICNPFGEGEFCNVYTYHAEDAYKHLQKIYKKEIPYVSDHYAMLVNTFERMYKGVLKECSIINPKYKYQNAGIMNSHQLSLLADEIDQLFSITQKRNTYDYFLEKLDEMSDGYTSSRYSDYYEFSDFAKGFELLERQREHLYKAWFLFKSDPDKGKNDIQLDAKDLL